MAGFLYSQLRRRYSFVVTNFVIGSICSVWHWPIIVHTRFLYAGVPFLFTLPMFTLALWGKAFVFGAMRERTGSVWPAVTCHAFLNYFSFVLVEPFLQPTEPWRMYFTTDTAGVFSALALVIAGAVAARFSLSGRSDMQR